MYAHSDSVVSALKRVEIAESAIFDTAERLMRVNCPIVLFDKFALATLNRAVAISDAFRLLIGGCNMIAAGPLVRIHLDTALRHFASHLVSDCNLFAESVMQGDQINRIVDRDGNKMSDFYLSTEFEKQIPGTRDLYERACSYIHFSRVHINSVTDNATLDRTKEENDLRVGFRVGAKDNNVPDEEYVGACDTFANITMVIIQLVQTWTDQKHKHSVDAG